MARSIGAEVVADAIWRPFATQNVILRLSGSQLLARTRVPSPLCRIAPVLRFCAVHSQFLGSRDLRPVKFLSITAAIALAVLPARAHAVSEETAAQATARSAGCISCQRAPTGIPCTTTPPSSWAAPTATAAMRV